MKILEDYDKLSERSDEIDTRKENGAMRDIILKLKEAIRENNLMGLAAPQLGYFKRIIVVNFKGRLVSYINPVITGSRNMHISEESCPSFPGKKYIHPRYSEINILFQNPLGKSNSQRLVGLAAVVFQELVDHLDGLLLPDIGLEVDNDFDEAPEEERAEVIKAYMSSLDIVLKNVNESIEADPDAKQMSDAIKFMQSVREGKTQITFERINREV